MDACRQLGHAHAMNENTGLKILAAPGALLMLLGIGYAYGLVGGCPRQTPQNAVPMDLTLVAAGIALSGFTGMAGYSAGRNSRR